MFVRVPTKLSGIFRFALIGNGFTICLAQICLTVGTTPTFLLPCFAFYTNGILLHLGLSPHLQFFIQIYIFALGAWCAAFICLLRAVAVTVHVSEQLKTGIIVGFIFVCTLGFLVAFWLHLETLMITNDEDRLVCSMKFNNNPPPEIYMPETMVRRAASTESVKASEDQRKLTVNILKLTFFQLSGISFPPLVLMVCSIISVFSTIVPMIVFVLLSINPLISCIIMLRLVPAYKKRLSTMCSSVLPVKLIERVFNSHPQRVSVSTCANSIQ
ncbi:unnamed protein product [Auanema sp. JU1783]|nr:unnamed protein product [Auanema sp. JU1783]